MAYSDLFKLDARDLQSEAEVETRLLAPLFKDLGYPATSVVPKQSLPALLVASGTKKASITPDFLLKNSMGAARVVVEAKDPDKSLADAWGQAAGYALTYNSDKAEPERIRWLLISNGHLTSLYPHDSRQPTLTLQLSNFVSGSPPYAALRAYIKHHTADLSAAAGAAFEVIAPDKLNALFARCHDLIWKKQKMSPADAFFEFCKFIFIKITKDKERELDPAKTGLFPMTTEWLDALKTTSKHPVKTLFGELRDKLEAAIQHEEKKRIFEPNETLRLNADTCRELIKRFEHINLSSIDEDLNGRMFEVFLNEAVRGRDLGQYFTPRPLVDFMTRLALSNYQDVRTPPKVIDACCGTAGFLIEVMAYQLAELRNDKRFNSKQRAALEKQIKNESLFGVEANERVSRIARINMYLHGDGGSHIFHGDGLDNHPEVTEDMSAEREDEVKDHRQTIREGEFDLVMSNPPFSMAYRASEPDEERILRQLAREATGTGDILPGIDGEPETGLDQVTAVKSNILFLYRYYKLLKPGGEMFIVLDDTVLNGESMETVRLWLMERFVLLGVYSLPFNAFFKAKANIKTSAIHLRKKSAVDDEQGHVFMAIINNIGHDSRLADTPGRNNLNGILNVYLEWRRTGHFVPLFERNQDSVETLECPEQVWLVSPEQLTVERLDAFYYAPELTSVREDLEALSRDHKLEVLSGEDFELRRKLTKGERTALISAKIPLQYIEISDVTRYGLITSSVQGTLDELPTRGQYQIEKGDVLMAVNISSRGTVVLVPEQFHEAICTSGFLVIKPRDEETGHLLWYSLRSEFCRRQIYYLAQTASQPELKLDVWRERFKVPLPMRQDRVKAIEESKRFHAHLNALLNADQYRLLVQDAPSETSQIA